MEIANPRTRVIRQANGNDRGAVFRLLRQASFAHVHSDWYLPSDWLGTPGFLVCEQLDTRKNTNEILGCMVAAADPMPVAWMRIVALNSVDSPEKILREMFEALLPRLESQGVSQLAWLPGRFWPQQWFRMLDFEEINKIATFTNDNMELLPTINENVGIRSVTESDFPELAQIEERAFAPLWRHSASGLQLANHQAVSFLVAEREGQIVGFQYAVPGHQPDSVHLVRITVDQKHQLQGIGTALMAAAFQDYRRIGIKSVSLNTQIDNIPSHHLYNKFGFEKLDDDVPLWAVNI